MDEIDITPLIRAHAKFEAFRHHLDTEQEQAGAIQAFEYTYELAWKTMKRLLSVRGKIVNNPRDAFREAALSGLISNPEVWFDFIKIRNITVHTYDEDTVIEVTSAFDKFSAALSEFMKNIT